MVLTRGDGEAPEQLPARNYLDSGPKLPGFADTPPIAAAQRSSSWDRKTPFAIPRGKADANRRTHEQVPGNLWTR